MYEADLDNGRGKMRLHCVCDLGKELFMKIIKKDREIRLPGDTCPECGMFGFVWPDE